MSTTLTLTSAPDPAWWKSRVVRRFLSHRMAVLGLVMITLLSLACAFGPYLLPYDSLQIDLLARFAPPLTGDHYLGADALGRDLAARLLMAGRISLLVGFFSMLLATFVGTLVGVIAGYMGGWVNTVLMRTVDGFLSFPTLFLLLALAVALKPSPVMITIIISLTSWMTVARIVATEVASLKEREFVLAGRMLGLSRAHIMFREILPNAMGPIIVAATLTVARAILLEAYISYLGFGIQPPLPSWGNMLNGAQQYLDRAPWLAIIPGLAITMAVTSFNLIGDGLRDALDIRSEIK